MQGVAADKVQRYHHGAPRFVPDVDVDDRITVSSSDLLCWLTAAFPRDSRGRLPITRIGQVFGVSASTVQRWIHLAETDKHRTQAKVPPLNEAGMKILVRRGILRGRGHYLWPFAGDITRDLTDRSIRMSKTGHANITRQPSEREKEQGRNLPHDVHLVHYPRAHVFGVAVSSSPKTEAKLHSHGEVLESIQAPNVHAATYLKQLALVEMRESRCIVPGHLIPSGRTETWRESAGGGTRLLEHLHEANPL